MKLVKKILLFFLVACGIAFGIGIYQGLFHSRDADSPDLYMCYGVVLETCESETEIHKCIRLMKEWCRERVSEDD